MSADHIPYFFSLFTLMMATRWPLLMRSILKRHPGWMRQGHSTTTKQTDVTTDYPHGGKHREQSEE